VSGTVSRKEESMTHNRWNWIEVRLVDLVVMVVIVVAALVK
jgi:hypothetical protein